MSTDLIEIQYADQDQANPYDLVEILTRPSGRGLDREQLLLELAQFTEANSALVAQFDQLTHDLIEYTGHPEYFVASPINLPDPIPLKGANSYPGDRHDSYRGIELLLNQCVTTQSGGERFLRYVNPAFYQPPQFLGCDKPAQSFWPLGMADINDESAYNDFRPPFLIALSIDGTQITIMPRLSDEAVEDRLVNMRAHELGNIGIVAGNRADEAAYLALLTDVRCVLTDPNLSPAAYRALTTELGMRVLVYVTAPEFESGGIMYNRVETKKLYRAIEIARADRMQTVS